MIKRLPLLAFSLLALGANAPVARGCDVTVTFNSYCCGPDKQTGANIKTYLEGRKDRLTYEKSSWGKEGEYDYCVTARNPEDRAAIYREIKGMMPMEENRKSSVSVHAKNMDLYKTKWTVPVDPSAPIAPAPPASDGH